MKYSADFETTTDINDCRVWLWAVQDIEVESRFYYNTDIESFIKFISRNSGSYYFHNEKFDGTFIIDYLLRNDWKWTSDRKSIDVHSFYTLISDMGQFYMIKLCTGYYAGRKTYVTIYDSMKLMNMSVEAVAETFKMTMLKLDIDYEMVRPFGYQPTFQEIEYIRHDVGIIAHALTVLFEQGMTKMTIGSNALSNFKDMFGGKNRFGNFFPPPVYDRDIRKSYKGAFTYLNPKFAGQIVADGIVLDVNSLYPSRMRYCLMPFDIGEYYTGKYEKDKQYPLYIQHISCQFELKEGYLPTIQLKNSSKFVATQYLSSSEGDYIELCLTSVDLSLFLDHYNVYNIDYISGWKFQGRLGLFDTYIDHWTEQKTKAKEEDNYGLYWLAKAMLNNLYGKFATNPERAVKMPYLDEHTNTVKFKTLEKEYTTPVYLPIGTFITAYARDYTIRTAQKCYDRFIYSDTDSLHLIGTDLPDIDIDDYRLGAWKHENTFKKAKFLHSKCYLESHIISDKEYNKMKEKEQQACYMVDGVRVKDKVTVAGLPARCHSLVNYENFNIGQEYGNKLKQTHVAGGIVLEKTTFTIKETKFKK